jgi:AcrR family transcriptional regulator
MGRPAGRPREPALSRGAIVAAALDIIDREGMAALSIRALGDDLGVNSASLYHHFENKDEILLGVARQVLRNVELREQPDMPWQAWMVSAAIEIRLGLLAHPNALMVILELHPRTFFPEPYNVVLPVLESHGVPADLALTILDGLEALAFGSALNTAYARTMDPEASTDPGREGLTRMYATTRYDDATRFEMSCYALIDGLTTQVAQLRPRTRRKAPKSAATGRRTSTPTGR